jgi:hypothetical protein
MIYRLILPDWITSDPNYNPREKPRVIEAELTDEELLSFNEVGYNCYWLPNHPSQFNPEKKVDGLDIDVFQYVYVDLDMKDYKSENKDRRHEYATKEEFITAISEFSLSPSMIVDSGNGIHVYWRMTDLDVVSFLRINRRLARKFHTDPAVSKVYQLMRVWGTLNTKKQGSLKLCELLWNTESSYTCEQLDKNLPRITSEDEEYCKTHFDKTYGLVEQVNVADELPIKWFKKFPKGSEGYKLFYGSVKDRSSADFRLGHLLFSAGFTKEEAMAVLTRTGKASERVGVHRYNYAEGIVQKVWVEKIQDNPKILETLSRSVRDILSANPDDETLKGTRFACNRLVDATECGFRLGHVLGLVAGPGAGKTTWALNLFYWFTENNPNYIHLFVSLEQPESEIAKRWKLISSNNPAFWDNVHVLGNYSKDNTYRNLSLQEIETHVKNLEKKTQKKVGCVVIDHIGVLKKSTKDGEFQGLIEICQYMKAFAINTNTFLIMQSQAPREKSGIGDLELDKDAAFGTSQFESFVDYLVTVWQPLKRIYSEADHMTVTCFKFCKIRHKDVRKDEIQEDVPYALMFDPTTEHLRKLTDDEKKAFDFFSKKATNLRNQDRKKEPRSVSDVSWVAQPKIKGIKDGKTDPDTNS